MTLSSLLIAVAALTSQPAPAAARGDVVSVNLRATFLNGQILDSTYSGAPYAFVLGTREFIQGYTRYALPALDRAIVGMKAGEKKTVRLKPEEAFGDLQVGEVPPGSPISFEVEMLEVLPKATPPALKIEELQVGTGAEAKDDSRVVVNYRGTFLNGVMFDSTYERPTPDGKTAVVPAELNMAAGGFIPGFLQGIKGMKVGGKRKVTIPHTLAYGPRGRSPVIPSYSTLVFELELVSVGQSENR